jgi:hypothetical protein
MVGGAIIPGGCTFLILGRYANALTSGKPVANMYFTLYGFNLLSQALNLCRDLKLGQYTKLPPQVTFTMQTIGTIIVCSSNLSWRHR